MRKRNLKIMKQECRMDSLNTCIRELQRQAHSQRLELEDANCEYEESRREQARPQEEMALREKAHRDTRIRNIHETEESKRAQELRVDDSLCKNREKIMLRYSSSLHRHRIYKKGELHERFKRFSTYRTDLQWKIVSNQQSFQVVNLCRAATEACHLIHGICLGHRKTLLAIHVRCSVHHRCLIKEFFTLRIKMPQVESQCREVHFDLSRAVEERSGCTIPMPMFCRKAVNHKLLPTTGNSTEFYGSSAKTADLGDSV